MGCLTKLVIALAVLAGLFVGADFIVRSIAERQVEQKLQDSAEISGETDVDIHGFPFLLQLARKRFGDVDVHGGELGNGQLQLTRFDATLHGVRPRPDNSSATVEAMDGSAFVSYADLQKAVARPGITVASGGRNQVRVTGSVVILGQTVTASALSKISVVDGNQLEVHATEINVPGLGVSSDVARAVGDRLDFVVGVRGLPQGLRLVGVQMSQDGVTAQVQGQNVLLQG
jgi:hypothetical protein